MFKKVTSLGFMVLMFMAFAITSNAQSPTVTVRNGTACTQTVTVVGSYTAGSCNWDAQAQATIPAGTSVTIGFIDVNTGLPTNAFVIGGIAQTATSYGQAPVNPLCATTITGNCGGTPYNVFFPAAFVVTVQ